MSYPRATELRRPHPARADRGLRSYPFAADRTSEPVLIPQFLSCRPAPDRRRGTTHTVSGTGSCRGWLVLWCETASSSSEGPAARRDIPQRMTTNGISTVTRECVARRTSVQNDLSTDFIAHLARRL